jgi:SSS family solute:Na+ symporter
VTLDVYKRALRPEASEKHLVRVGMWASVVILLISIGLAGFIDRLGTGLFVYIQSLYAFFAPPFAAVFLLGILWRRINGQGAIAAVVLGFAFGIAMKVYVQYAANPIPWIVPYAMQSIVNWTFCAIVCVGISLLTARPRPEQVTDQLTFNWSRLNIFQGLGSHWYTHVVLWWGLFVLLIGGLVVVFSGVWL